MAGVFGECASKRVLIFSAPAKFLQYNVLSSAPNNGHRARFGGEARMWPLHGRLRATEMSAAAGSRRRSRRAYARPRLREIARPVFHLSSCIFMRAYNVGGAALSRNSALSQQREALCVASAGVPNAHLGSLRLNAYFSQWRGAAACAEKHRRGLARGAREWRCSLSGIHRRFSHLVNVSGPSGGGDVCRL